MFILSQTYEGLKITVNSIIESNQFLLHHKVKYVLTEHFCQDPLENYFGSFINATLSKNQLYKYQDQIKKAPTISN